MNTNNNNMFQHEAADPIAEARRLAAEREGKEPAASSKAGEFNPDDYLVWASDEIPMPTPILFRGDDEIIHLGDIQTIDGPPKSKKTFLVSAMCAAAIGCKQEDCLGFEYNADADNSRSCKVLYIDTEQADGLTVNILRRINIMAGQGQKNINQCFKTINLRERKSKGKDKPQELPRLTAQDRRKIAFTSLERYRPMLCIIDGIKDLCEDFNNQLESRELVEDLMAASQTYNCAILCIIHQNFGSDKARGHIGSYLYEKSSVCLSLNVSDPNGENITNVSVRHSRYAPPKNFAFKLNEKKLPELTTPPVKTAKSEIIKIELEAIMKPYEPMMARELAEALAERMHVRFNTAQKYLGQAVKDKILNRFGESSRNSRYYLHSDPLEVPECKQDNLPF